MLFMLKFQCQYGKKHKSGKNFFGFQNEAIRWLQIGARGITNKGSFRDFKSGQKDSHSGQGFQIEAKRFQIGAEITNQGKRDLKSIQGLQIGAEHQQVYFSDNKF